VDAGLSRLGLSSLARPWLADPHTALAIVILAVGWQWNALATVTFLAGLQNVPAELRDAARADGATELRVFRDVTLPHLAPAFTIVNVLLAIITFRAFDLVYVLGGPLGAPAGATLVMGVTVYGSAFGSGLYSTSPEMSYGMAQGVVLFLFLGLFALGMLIFLSRRERRVY